MASIQAAVSAAFDWLMRPVSALPAAVGLLVLAAATAFAMVRTIEVTSDKKRAIAARNRMHAALFEMRLFNDDIGAVARAGLELLSQNLAYLRALLVPAVVMAVPFMFLIGELEAYYGHSGLLSGETTLVSAHLRDQIDAGAIQTAQLTAPVGIRVDTKAVWFPATREVVWRVQALTPGDFKLRLAIAGNEFTKSLRVSPGVARRSPRRSFNDHVQDIFFRSEPPLPAGGPITDITIDYSRRDVVLLGLRMNWLTGYVVLLIVSTGLARRVLRVTF